MKRSARSGFLMLIAVAVLIGALTAPAVAEVKLPNIFGSHMVLQRDKALPVWGWADAGEKVTVELGSSKVATEANSEGEWKTELPAREAGGPFKMTVTGEDNTIVLTDVLVGEVWVGSGQSNMQFAVQQVNNAEEEIASADYPEIRLFYVARTYAGYPDNDVPGEWQVCSTKTVPGFSAALYFFGRDLYKELDVPFGLIHSSWGGTRIEPWTPPEGFAQVDDLEPIVKQIEQANKEYPAEAAKAFKAIDEWMPKARKAIEEQLPVPDMPKFPPHPLASNHQQPTALYNAMIHGMVPFAIRGTIWYQGEANVGEGMMYYQKMRALIGGWRKVWNQGAFPFYFVQLAPFQYNRGEALPEIWQAQLTALKNIPNTGMPVITDLVDNLKDIHPKNKQDVGHRLALWALANVYDRDVVYSGPLYESAKAEDGKAVVSFSHVDGGLAARGGKDLTSFEIAGEDGKFVQANAEIKDDTVVVWSDDVEKPAQVRFGWNEIAQPNLINKKGLPASPFRAEVEK